MTTTPTPDVRPAPTLAELVLSWRAADRVRTMRLEARYETAYRKGRNDAADILAAFVAENRSTPAGVALDALALDALVERMESTE